MDEHAPNTPEEDHDPRLTPLVDQDEFELELARVFHLCALSFIVVESPVFQRFFHRLAPHFMLPSRKKLGGSLLDKLAIECETMVVKRVRRQGVVSVVTDAWSNVKKASIMNYMVVAPGMPSLLWRSVPTGSAAHDAAYVAAEL